MAGEIPDIVIGRLPIYLRELKRLTREEKTTTSSQELGRRLGISSAQIRKDLSHFGEFGKQGTGYHIEYGERRDRKNGQNTRAHLTSQRVQRLRH